MSIEEPVGGFSRCPTCGSTEITYSPRTGSLVCQFCRHSWREERVEQALGFDTQIDQLSGTIVAQGAGRIAQESPDIVTLKCQGCGAEVVINSATSVQARCHWCRSILSLDARMPNGSVPDAVLPFAVTHEQATESIRQFVAKRRGFAHTRFKREFQPENVMGVFLPYFVVDVNAEIDARGVGEVETRQYTVRRNDHNETRYDADVYQLGRAFKLTMDDLIMESSARRSAGTPAWETETSNIINAILPFDTKSAVQFDPNYLGRFTSEKRDLDVSDVGGMLHRMVFGTGTTQIRDTLSAYTRGVRWESGSVTVKGSRFLTMYAPIWLYSYYERTNSGHELLHYIAVNGRSGATMGSVPVNKGKLTMAAVGIAILGYVPILGAFLWWV